MLFNVVYICSIHYNILYIYSMHLFAPCIQCAFICCLKVVQTTVPYQFSSISFSLHFFNCLHYCTLSILLPSLLSFYTSQILTVSTDWVFTIWSIYEASWNVNCVRATMYNENLRAAEKYRTETGLWCIESLSSLALNVYINPTPICFILHIPINSPEMTPHISIHRAICSSRRTCQPTCVWDLGGNWTVLKIYTCCRISFIMLLCISVLSHL